MTIVRLSLLVAVLASASMACGCDAKTFASVNDAFAATKKTSAALSNTALPAAAIATSLGAIELVRALSSHSKSLNVAGAGNLNLGGSGIVSAGAGNLTSKFFILDDATTCPAATADSVATSADVTNPDSKVKMHAVYASTKNADGSTTSAISSFTGNTQGYDVNASGCFTYKPGDNGGADGAAVSCAMSGTVKYDTTTLTLKTLNFATSDPLPTSNASLGGFTFTESDGTSLVATLAIDANGKIVASGDITDKDGKKSPLSNFGADGGSILAGAAAAGTN